MERGRPVRPVLCGLVAVLVLCGCAPAPDGRLLVEREVSPAMDNVWLEGSVGFVRLTQVDRVVFEEGFDAPSLFAPGDPTADPYRETRLVVPLAPGTYRLDAWQRPCEGTCEGLDAPTHECGDAVEVPPGGDVPVVIRVVTGGCTVVAG